MPEPIPPPSPQPPPIEGGGGGGLSAPFHGAPKWVWLLGGGAVLFLGYRYWKGKQAGAGTTSSTGLPPGVTSPLPGWTGLGSALGPLGGSSPTGPIIGYDSQGNPIYGVNPPAPGTPPPTPGGDGNNTPPPSGAPGPPSPGAGSPADRYSVGQVVNPQSGEKVVAAVFSPVYGWLNETNKGGIYTGGGGSQGIGGLPFGGSYLGYVQQRFGNNTPAAQQEMAIHGAFGASGLSLLPGGGYVETNTRGETYRFGS